MNKFEVRDINGNVILTTKKVDVFNYCRHAFKVVMQVASHTNYIVVDGYRHENMKETIEEHLKNMLEMG